MRRRAAAVVVVAAVVVLAVAVLLAASVLDRPAPRSGDVDGARWSTLREGNLVLEHPPSWRVFHYDVAYSFSSLIAYIGSIDVPDPCVRTGESRTCGDGVHLEPNSVVVEIAIWSVPGGSILDLREGAIPVRVAGLPAWRRDRAAVPATGADRMITWEFARPDSVTNWYALVAQVRGPDLALLEAQVSAIVASIRWDPPVEPLDRSPAGQRRALDTLDRFLVTVAADDPTWGCFPRAVGAQEVVITREPNGPALAAPLPVRCSTSLRPTELERWEVTLRIDWGFAPGESAGHWLTRLYPRGDQEGWESTGTESDPFPGS